jgi:hypothetical protein
MVVQPEIENLAKKILEEANSQDDNYGIDPITIIILIGITLSLIRVIQECRKKRKSNRNEDAEDLKNTIMELSVKKSIINNYRLNKILKQHLNKNQYLLHGKAVKNAIFKIGQNLDERESLAMLNIE